MLKAPSKSQLHTSQSALALLDKASHMHHPRIGFLTDQIFWHFRFTIHYRSLNPGLFILKLSSFSDFKKSSPRKKLLSSVFSSTK
jgi:hypothetical protein